MTLYFVKEKNPSTKYGVTPLFIAAESGNIAAFKLFSELNRDKNPIKKFGLGWTPFHFALRKSHLETYLERGS